jgi:hypothetical protein
MKKSRREKTGRARGQKNEGRKERLKAFIDEKESIRRRKPVTTPSEIIPYNT